jgi:hypothetical protein
MAFVGKEAEVNVGALTVISTHAQIDQPDCKRSDIVELLARFDQAGKTLAPA